MSTRALRIWEQGEVEAVQLSDTHAAQKRELAYLVGGPTDTGVYHRQAVLHIHGMGAAAQDLQFNAVAWALARAWRGRDVTYGLYGPLVVTGPADPAGGHGALSSHLEAQVHDVCAAVSDVHAEWRTRPRPVRRQPARNSSQRPGSKSPPPDRQCAARSLATGRPDGRRARASKRSCGECPGPCG